MKTTKSLVICAGLLAAATVAALWAVPVEPAEPDRVGFPADYQAKYEVIRVSNRPKAVSLGTIYANERAASVKEMGQLPYPEGSVIVMEWAEPLKDSAGVLLVDANGLWRKGKVVRIDVMRRERGYGEAYGGKRVGEWEFASYKTDGSYFQPPAKPAACAACHQEAGAERDFVYRGRFPPGEGN